MAGTLQDAKLSQAVTGLCMNVVACFYMVPLGICQGARIRVANLLGTPPLDLRAGCNTGSAHDCPTLPPHVPTSRMYSAGWKEPHIRLRLFMVHDGGWTPILVHVHITPAPAMPTTGKPWFAPPCKVVALHVTQFINCLADPQPASCDHVSTDPCTLRLRKRISRRASDTMHALAPLHVQVLATRRAPGGSRAYHWPCVRWRWCCM